MNIVDSNSTETSSEVSTLLHFPNAQERRFTILVRGGFETVVDEDVYYQIRLVSWRIHKPGKSPLYVCGNIHGKVVFLHHFVLNVPKGSGLKVDHWNGDTLDNRRENLRLCTDSQNQANRSDSRGTSQFKGVHLDRDTGHWVAAICKDRKSIHLGTFETEEDAARAYNAEALSLFGEFACLNLVGDTLTAARRLADREGQFSRVAVPVRVQAIVAA
jgi:hypothetical protein